MPVQRTCEELAVYTMIDEERLYPAEKMAFEKGHLLDAKGIYMGHFLVVALIEKLVKFEAGESGGTRHSRH